MLDFSQRCRQLPSSTENPRFARLTMNDRQGENGANRHLNYRKCIQCRTDKEKVGKSWLLPFCFWDLLCQNANFARLEKCKPADRVWPQKCKRCILKKWECSESMSAEEQRAHVQRQEQENTSGSFPDSVLEQFVEL